MTRRPATVVTRSAAETQNLGAKFAASLPPGTVLLLEGDLGAGKTTFVRGLARGLSARVEPRSPSFALVRDYGNLVHVDLYRVAPADVDRLGLDDYFDARRIIAVEWGRRAPRSLWRGLTVVALLFEITGEEERAITLTEDDALPSNVRLTWEGYACGS